MLCCVFNCFLLLLLLHMLLTFQSDWKCLSMKTASSTLHIPQPLQLMLNSEIYHFEHCIWGNHTYFIYPFLIIYLFYFNIIIIWKNRTLNTLWIYLMNDFNKDLQSTIWEHYMSPCKMGFFFCFILVCCRDLGTDFRVYAPISNTTASLFLLWSWNCSLNYLRSKGFNH